MPLFCGIPGKPADCGIDGGIDCWKAGICAPCDGGACGVEGICGFGVNAGAAVTGVKGLEGLALEAELGFGADGTAETGIDMDSGKSAIKRISVSPIWITESFLRGSDWTLSPSTKMKFLPLRFTTK